MSAFDRYRRHADRSLIAAIVHDAVLVGAIAGSFLLLDLSSWWRCGLAACLLLTIARWVRDEER